MFHFREDFCGEYVDYKNKKKVIRSTLVWAKHISDLAARTISEKQIKKPKVIFRRVSLKLSILTGRK